jgi:hypothetical protein
LNTRRTRLSILAAIPVALATLGCDSTQPDQITSQAATLSVGARAIVDTYDCYEVWDVSQVPETNLGVLCGEDSQGKAERAVPWHYSLEVSLLRAGQTTPEVIGSSVVPGDTMNDFVSLTPYDTVVENAAAKPAEPPYEFRNGKRVSRGSEEYLTSLGVQANLGPPNILEQTLPEGAPTYGFDVNPGDTIIVQARKQPDAEGPPSVTFDPNPELRITGVLTVAGVQVQVSGEPTSQDANKAGISFSYTRQ